MHGHIRECSLRYTASMKWLLVCMLLASMGIDARPSRWQEDLPPNWNIPRAVWDRFKSEKILERYEISPKLNPFYLRGDFDGDGVPDYAVLVTNRNTKATGIAVVRSRARHAEILGAGGVKLRVAALPDGSPPHWVDDFTGYDAWHVAPKKQLKKTGWDKPITKMTTEGIVVERTEASGGLIYWDGKRYRWLQISN